MLSTRTVTTRFPLAAGAAAVVALSALLPMGSAGAADINAEDADGAGRMMLVLDSSGSMSEPAAGGTTKIAAAKDALRTVIGGLDDDQQVGLRVYGATVFSRSDPGACTDSQQVVAPGTDNRDELRAEVQRYRPFGETPIGHALQQAADDLGAEGARTIVLVSDGEATCPPSPCRVAARIAAQGIAVRIDVVGLDVSGAARRQLQCVAAAGRGTYYDATDADDLTRSLDDSTTRAARPFGFQGTPVEGTPSETGAPVIGVGSWTDTLGATGSDTELRTYLVERSIPGSTLHMSATALTPGTEDALVVAAWEPRQALRGEDCDAQQAVQLGTSPAALLSTGVTVGPYTAFDQSEACLSGDQIPVTVIRGNLDGGFGGDSDVPLALHVIEEPPVEGVDELPLEADEDAAEPARARFGGPRVTGGTSFDDAPVLDSGFYTSDVVAGETRVFLVEVDWGQRLDATVSLPELPDGEERTGNAQLTIYGPNRREAGQITGSDQTLVGTFFDQLNKSTYPVRYLNRGGVNEQPGSALPGTYAVAVSLSRTDEDTPPPPVEYALDLDVSGDVQGEPRYTEAAPTPADEATPTADATEQAPEESDAEGTEGTEGTGGTEDGTEGGTENGTAGSSGDPGSDTDEASADDGGVHPALPFGLGSVGAAAIAGAVLLALRGRRNG